MRFTKKSMRFAVLGAAMSVFVVPLTPATALPQVVAIAGVAHLAGGLSSPGSVGCFGGTAVGASADPSVSAASEAHAHFNYSNPETVFGDADGTLAVHATVGPHHQADFHWERFGVVAVVTGQPGSETDIVAVAAFAPVDIGETGDCGTHEDTRHPAGGAHAALAGAGIITPHGDHDH